LKKRYIVLFTLLLAVLLMTNHTPLTAAPDVKVKVDGQYVTFPDQKPYINAEDRTMVPVRAPMEALGCRVEWNNTDKKAFIMKGSKVVVFTIGSNIYTVNGVEKKMDTKPEIKNDRTAFPIRFAAEAVGAYVDWDQKNYTVLISSLLPGPVGIEPKFRAVTGSGNKYLSVVIDNASDFVGSGYKFRVECISHPEFNTYTQRLPVYGPPQYQTIKVDDWEPSVNWWVGTAEYAHTPPAKAGQVVKYRIYMKDKTDQIVRIYEGQATLANDGYKVVAPPVIVKGE
jgi:hypothetical protein